MPRLSKEASLALRQLEAEIHAAADGHDLDQLSKLREKLLKLTALAESRRESAEHESEMDFYSRMSDT